MDWIFEHGNIVLILLLAFASWVKARMDKKAEEEDETADPTVWEDEKDEWTPPSVPPPLERREAEPFVPPPLVRNEPRPAVPPPLPPAMETVDVSDVLEQQRKLEEEFGRIRRAKQARPMPQPKTRQRKTHDRAAPPTTFTKMLRDKSAVRRAVVLREVLGPPVGMR